MILSKLGYKNVISSPGLAMHEFARFPECTELALLFSGVYDDTWLVSLELAPACQKQAIGWRLGCLILVDAAVGIVRRF